MVKNPKIAYRLFRNVTIKRKVMLIMMLTSSVALLLASAGFVIYELVTFRATMVSNVTSDAELIGDFSAGSIYFENPEEAYNNLAIALNARKHITAAALYRISKGNSQIFTNYPPTAVEDRLVPVLQETNRLHFEKYHLVLTVPTIWKGNTNGAIYLRTDLRELDARLKDYAGIAAFVMVASFLASLFLSAQLQRVISEPVLHLADTAQKVSQEKNYSVRAIKQSNDELGELIDGFNAMLGQIQLRDAELQNSRDGLEVRVQERTSELQQQVTRISLLNQITYAVAARQDLDSIVLVVLQQLEEHLPVDYGAAYLFDSQNKMMTAMVRGPKSRPIAETLELPQDIFLNETPFGECAQGEMVYVPDASQLTLDKSQRMARAGFPSLLATPLIVENKVFGLLIFARRGVDSFSAAEREFIRGLSAHVALAVHQAQLYLDLHKAYNDLRQTQQAVMQQQRLQALGQMASGIAHDINNALSPVIAYSDLLQQSEPNLSAHARKILGHIKTAGDDIAHIVARMREFYRHRDEMEKFIAISAQELIEQVIEMTRPRWRDIPQSRGTAIEMKTEFAAALPEIVGNASEVREALTNLILNAVDAMPKGGTIVVRSRLASFGGSADEFAQKILLEVSDTGSGMDDETRRRCLEPFFSTKGQRGTGLGLAMVYGVMERHEGTIEIESEVGKGTTMRLVFPVREMPADGGAPEIAEIKLPSLRILCIDDEPLLRDVMKQILEADGHKVQVADGGQSGIEAFRAARAGNHPFEIVITDLGMPHLNGRQVAQIVKRESPTTPVIMLTGWGALMKAQGDSPAQVDGVLSKPPRISEIREKLHKCLVASDQVTQPGSRQV
jgi:signal transduction histidine kinase/ActR/RegA family two-component response regulator/HAMP domain-containing protein